jgi:DNA-binding response OmpR family regulator
MRQQGYEVRTAADGETALAEIERQPPDVVLLDVNIPRLNGFEVCERIRANPEWRAVRILMLTAKGREVEREKGLALGADGYVIKPFATRELIAQMRELLATPRS